MEKVAFRGLMWSRDEEFQGRKIESDGRCGRGRHEICEGMEAACIQILDRERRVDTQRRGRAAARQEFAGWQSSLRRIGKTFRNQSPRNLGRGQSLDESHGRLTGGTAPLRLGRSRF
jgi:hypothetical protein